MEQKVFETPKGNIVYWISKVNEEKPWLIFLPGLTADHRLFDKQVEFFEGTYNLFVWDAPAHALSRPFDLNYTLEEKTAWLADILNLEGITKPILIGQSMGGYVSQMFIELYPGVASGFISIDSAPLKRVYYPNWEVKFLYKTKGMYMSIPWSLLKKWGTAGTTVTPYGRSLMSAFMADYTKEEYCSLADAGYNMLARAIDARRPYQIDCPCILICGKKDMAGDVKVFNRRWEKGDNLKLYWIEGAGHNSNTDRPEEVNALISSFVEEIS